MTNLALRLRIGAATSALVLGTLGFVSSASAQDAVPSTETALPDQEADDQGQANEIVVTGSRIPRPEIDNPNPVVSYGAESLAQSGRTNLTDFLVQNPALLGSSTSADQSGSSGGFGATGVNLLNLRNLGTARTLVLVDGRRHVAGLSGSASVDINTIPKALVERIDVQTGGASAVYGADGVSGVVNFILKRNFEGIEASGQAGISEEGDAGNRFVSITAGQNFAGDRGNVAINYEFTEDDRVNSFERARTGDPLRTFGFVQNPDDLPGADNPSVFDRILLNNLRYADSSRDGAVDLDLDFAPDFTGSGGVYDRGRLLPSSGGLTQGGSSTPLAGYQGDLQPQNRIHNVNVLSSFEVSPALRIYAQGKYTNIESFTVAQPSFDFYTYLASDNAYLQDRFGVANTTNGAFISRDNFDLGVRGETTTRETWRGVIGADGEISDNARYDLSYTYGVTDSTFFSTNYRLGDRYFAALDAVRNPTTGEIVCRIALDPTANIDPNNWDAPPTTFNPSECVPLNILGENVRSQAALDFINVDLLNRVKVQQHVVSGSIAGDFGQFFELPGGPIAFALGGEYRKEISDYVSDPFLQQGALLDIGQILPESGEFDVIEGFAELRVPLFRNQPFAELLEFNAALRLSDYSTIGGTTTYAFGGVYAPVRDFRVRGTYSQAVRAPNVSELFSPTNGTFLFIDDPCDPVNIPEGTQFRRANCTAALTALGINPATFSPTSDPTATVSLPGRVGGNPNLSEETARTWTVGTVIQPRFVPGLTVTADWYDIKLEDAVRTPEAQDIVDLCVDQPDLNNVFCDSITRDPNTGYVSDYLVVPQNVAAFETAGLDVQVNYLFNLDNIGDFSFTLKGNYLDKLTFVPTPGADVESDKLEQLAPEYSGQLDLAWSNGTLSLNYGLNYFSKTRRFTADQVRANPDISDPEFLFFRERFEHDFQAAIDVNEQFRFYGGVNNFTNEQGDIGSAAYPFGAIGRYFYAGARVSFK